MRRRRLTLVNRPAPPPREHRPPRPRRGEGAPFQGARPKPRPSRFAGVVAARDCEGARLCVLRGRFGHRPGGAAEGRVRREGDPLLGRRGVRPMNAC